ncbi:MAG: tetratricopeptide repeat protein [Reyranella sp.]|uniref:tetratricopeptide repeat protein n=1 Tax=Reyranella sp. TaxID=1929291 RepID=UPI001AD4BB1C|nr:tetratricopeptide repeat protein [Reyranella sp.]MBN9090435.1 tetratricopeptide repeat protein [Reyranella sp.]
MFVASSFARRMRRHVLAAVLAIATSMADGASAQTTEDPVYRAAFEEMLRKPADPPTLLRYAELAVKAGNLEGAISALERLLLIDPDLPHVRLELGVLYYRLGSYEAARGYLESARDTGRGQPAVAEPAERYLAEIHARTRRFSLGGELLGGVRYSSNANSGPVGTIQSFGSSVVPSPNISRQSDWGVVAAAALQGRYDLGRQDNGAFEADLSLYGARQFSVASANVALVDLFAGPRFSPFEGFASSVSLKPFFTGRYVAVHDLTAYWAWGAGVEASIPVAPGSTVDLTGFGRRREYVSNADAPTNNNSTGNEGVVAAAYRLEVTKQVTVTLAGNFTRYVAVVPSENYWEYGLSAALNVRFADPIWASSRLWRLVLSADVAWANYDRPDPAVDPARVRSQNDYNFGLVLAVPVNDQFSIVAQGAYTRRDASIANYAYDAFTAMTGVSWRF